MMNEWIWIKVDNSMVNKTWMDGGEVGFQIINKGT
jgi:hypothetical protein